MFWQGPSGALPRIKHPPDKPSYIFTKKVSAAVDKLYKSSSAIDSIPTKEKVIDNRLPSNLSAAVSAENLKNEILGKLCKNLDLIIKGSQGFISWFILNDTW